MLSCADRTRVCATKFGSCFAGAPWSRTPEAHVTRTSWLPAARQAQSRRSDRLCAPNLSVGRVGDEHRRLARVRHWTGRRADVVRTSGGGSPARDPALRPVWRAQRRGRHLAHQGTDLTAHACSDLDAGHRLKRREGSRHARRTYPILDTLRPVTRSRPAGRPPQGCEHADAHRQSKTL
jgi:hypothetical protein